MNAPSVLPPTGPVSRAAWWSLLAAGATGLAVFLLHALAPAYLPSLLLHLAFGAALLVLGPLALAVHLRHTGSPQVRTAAVLGLGGLLSWPVLAALHFPEPASFLERQLQAFGAAPARAAAHERPAAWLQRVLDGGGSIDPGTMVGTVALVLLLGCAGLLSVSALGARLDDRAAARRSGLGLTLLASWATVGGAVLYLQDRENLFGAMTLHSVAGTGTTVVLVLHLLTQAAARLRWGRVVFPLLGATMLAATSAGWWRAYAAEHFTGFDPERKGQVFFEAEMPTTAAARARSLQGSGAPPAWTLEGSRACGGGGCHETIVQDWLGSPHRHAGDNLLYQAALTELLASLPSENAVFCATCHDPVRALSGTVDESVASGLPPAESDGVGCAVCHGISRVHGRLPSNAAFTVAWDRDPLGGTTLGRVRTMLDPRHHRQRFVTRSVSLDGRPCEGCHRVVVGKDLGLAEDHVVQFPRPLEDLYGGEETNCVTCHLPQDRTGLYRHRMAGINTDLATYVGPVDTQEQQALEAQHAAARDFVGAMPWVPITSAGWPTPPPAGSTLEGERRPAGRGVLWLRLDGGFQPEAGTLSVVLRTMNLGIGHDFPAGPLDLNEVWLELRVEDGAGQVIHHEGALQADGSISGAPRRLGGRELRADDQPVLRHRLWELDHRADHRVLRSESLVDTWAVPWPPEAARPAEVRVRWLFRRAPPEFSRWAGSLAGRPDLVFPGWELAAATGELR